jgi:polyisoprenoid-binding protein YceI
MKRIITFLLFTLLASIGYAQNFTPVDEGSSVKFTIKNFGFSTSGSFSGLKGSVRFDADNTANASFSVSLNAGSVNTDNQARDKHLRKEEYFDIEKYPLISFVSSSVSANAKPGTYLMLGKLTIKGIAKDIYFPFTATAQNDGYLFSGSFKINRRDFKVGGSSMVLADNLKVLLSVFAKKN